MAMEHFFDALEILSSKLFQKGDIYENLKALILTIKGQNI